MSPKSQENVYIVQVESILKVPYIQAQSSARWLSKQSLALQASATEQSIEVYLKLKKQNSGVSKEILSIAANLYTASHIHTSYKSMYRKNKNLSSDDLILLNLFEINSFAKKTRVAKKRDFLMRHKKRILQWREQSISFEDISVRLVKDSISDNFDLISAEYIRRTCGEVI